MKKIISIILCAMMLLSLVGCSEEAKLYEKYADIITMLEEENYTGVMGVVSAMAVAQQNEGNERPMIVTEVEGEWLQVSSDYTGAPGKIAIRQDGTCTVDGKDMLWLERGSNDNNLDGVILDGGEYKFCFSFHRDSEDRSMPYIDLWTCRIDGENVYSDKHMGNYRNHPQYTAVTRWWSILDGDTGIDNSFDIYSGSMYYNDTEYKWKITSAANEMPVVITAIANDGSDATLTLTMAERDGHNVMTVVNDATGESGLYYNEEYGYESSWPEYQYPQLLKHLRSYLNGYSFWVEELDTYISKNEARAYLYEQFKLLGDYKDSANVVSRFVIIPHLLTKVIQRTTDQLGNVSDSTQATYDYDITSRIIKSDGAELIERFGIYETWSYFYPEYDAEGKVVGVNISNDPVTAVCTPTYNAAGQLESMHVQTTSKQYTSTFTYDEQGRLIQLDIPYGTSAYDQYVYTYTYDNEGRVIEKIKSWNEGRYKSVYTYTYEGLAVIQQVESYQYRDKEEYSTTMVFTNDSHGCHLSAIVTTTQSSATYAAREMVYQYEDLYFFNDTGIEVPEDSSMPIVISPIN